MLLKKSLVIFYYTQDIAVVSLPCSQAGNVSPSQVRLLSKER